MFVLDSYRPIETYYWLKTLRLSSNLFTNNVKWLVNLLCCYIGGFPCTPYSFLHVGTQLLQDPNARQLFRILRNCRQVRPAVTRLVAIKDVWWCMILSDVCTCVHQLITLISSLKNQVSEIILLENVMGFERVLDRILSLIRRNLVGYLARITSNLVHEQKKTRNRFEKCVLHSTYEVWMCGSPSLTASWPTYI